MSYVPPSRLLTLTMLGFALTTIAGTLEPAVLGHKVIQFVADGERNTALGRITFVGLIVAIVVQPIVGALSDRTRSRWGRRLPYIAAGACLAIVSLYLLALASSFGSVIGMLLLVQCAIGMMQAPWQALIPDLVPDQQRGRASGLKAVFEILASLVSRYAAGQFVGRYAAWGVNAILAAVSLPVMVLIVAFAVTARGMREEPSNLDLFSQRSLRDAVKDTFVIDFRAHPAFVWWFANRFFFWCAFIATTAFLLFFLIDGLGLTADEAQRQMGQLAVPLSVAPLLVLIPASWLADHIGRKPLVITSGLLAAAGVLILLITHTPNTIVIGVLVVGVGAGIFITANWALITDIVPRGETARYLGIATIASASGSAVARLVGGSLIDSINKTTGSLSAGYYALFGIAALFFVISAFVAIHISPPRINTSTLPQD